MCGINRRIVFPDYKPYAGVIAFQDSRQGSSSQSHARHAVLVVEYLVGRHLRWIRSEAGPLRLPNRHGTHGAGQPKVAVLSLHQPRDAAEATESRKCLELAMADASQAS